MVHIYVANEDMQSRDDRIGYKWWGEIEADDPLATPKGSSWRRRCINVYVKLAYYDIYQ